ncbi:MAG: hypothetical protein ACD_75C02438G0002, partial [uncultured bacterium]
EINIFFYVTEILPFAIKSVLHFIGILCTVGPSLDCSR